jgi:hypothetical protein
MGGVAVQPPPPQGGRGWSIIPGPPPTSEGGGGGSDSTGQPPPPGTGGDGSGAGQAWGFLGGFAAVVLPLAVLSETLAYLFNLGWAAAFSIPIWLVPASGPPLTVLLCGTAAVFVFVALAFINARRTWRREIREHAALKKLLPAGTVISPKPSYRWPELNFETLQLTVRARPLEVLASLAMLAVLSTAAGNLIPRSGGSWSFVDSKCIVVAAFGDVLIASDAEKLARSDGTRRVAPDFTVYRSDAIPQLWNEDARLAVIESDSARAHRPMLECPKPPMAPSRSSSQPKT